MYVENTTNWVDRRHIPLVFLLRRRHHGFYGLTLLKSLILGVVLRFIAENLEQLLSRLHHYNWKTIFLTEKNIMFEKFSLFDH